MYDLKKCGKLGWALCDGNCEKCRTTATTTTDYKRMNDLISRQAAIELAKDICVPIKDGTVYRHRCIDPDAIKELPSECYVIYCRDCMFYLGHRCQATRGLDDWRNQDDYCSRAEKI